MSSSSSVESLCGRSAELAQLVGAVEGARAGRGGLWFVSGEPGIGKSRLCEELARLAQERGVCAHFGRCWEAGGAPAFWPFIQVLRSVLSQAEAGALLARLSDSHVGALAELLPELRASLRAEPSPPLAPEQARFRALDAVAALLGEAARSAPLLLVLEDLHAADPSSVYLLDFLSGSVRGAPIAIVGNYRDTGLSDGEVGPQLARVAAQAHALSLPRLSRDDVARCLAAQLVEPPADELVASVYATSEGNPLFVVEMARLMVAHGRSLPAGDSHADGGSAGLAQPRSVPTSIRSVLQDRLARLSPSARALLELAAVVGREFDRATLFALSDDVTGELSLSGELALTLCEAVDAAVLSETSPGHYRFTHILLREVLHQALPPARRQRLHARLAEHLGERPVDELPLSTIAHHYLQAGPDLAERAAETAEQAAERAAQQLAFEDAAALYRLALDAAPAARSAPDVRIRRLLGLSAAQTIAGRHGEGRAACMQAAAIARAADLPEQLAHAALGYGRIFVIARIDETLVALLREALLALGEGDSPLRARVMARLAAAEQPAADPSGPIEMALAALAMARRCGTPADLLASLRSACSALADLAPPDTRARLNQEHEQLSTALGDAVEAQRGAMRLSFDLFELGDVAAARAAITRAARHAEQLDHPHYRWRVAAFAATVSIFEGRFDDAARHGQVVAALGQKARDPNLAVVCTSQALAVARLRGDTAAALRLADELDQHYAHSAFDLPARQLVLYAERLRARAPFDDTLPGGAIDAALATGDRTLFEHLVEVASARADRDLARCVLAQLQPHADQFVHGGMLGMTWGAPVAVLLARLQALLGQVAAAEQLFTHAIARTQAAGTRPFEAWVREAFARFLFETGQTARARTQVQAARALCDELDLPGLRARLQALSPDATDPPSSASDGSPEARPPAPVPTLAVRFTREGETFWIEAGDQRFALKDTKGVRMLAQLIEAPGRAFHVLELSMPGGASDTGDAGELIDAEARERYRARVRSLQRELEQAEADNDLARAEPLRAELEALTDELSRAVGLGGRARRASSASERARVNVQRRLKDAMKRAGKHSPELARHLAWAVRTGTFCSYDPS